MTSLVTITKENFQLFLQKILEVEELSFPSPWTVHALKSEIENPISHLWALIMGKVFSGYICFWMFDREIQLISVAIHPHDRGRGLGHYLLKEMIETGISKGMRQIWLEVRSSNLVAKGLYERLGFEEAYRRPGYYPDTHEDAIVMGLNLSRQDPYRLISN
ncbi:MAG: ribosomal protein S18-alanine N-acetyltransferase [Deltaproteobacteria bacterium]|nr:MAG: ribosomal protein S18-alanine N-acetyltransferase [Deltaproteobacteria bacterium]